MVTWLRAQLALACWANPARYTDVPAAFFQERDQRRLLAHAELFGMAAPQALDRRDVPASAYDLAELLLIGHFALASSAICLSVLVGPCAGALSITLASSRISSSVFCCFGA